MFQDFSGFTLANHNFIISSPLKNDMCFGKSFVFSHTFSAPKRAPSNFFLFSILQCVCMWTWTLIPPHPPTRQPSTESKNMLLYDGTICYACEYVICKHKKDVVNGLEDVYTFFIIFYFSIYWECAATEPVPSPLSGHEKIWSHQRDMTAQGPLVLGATCAMQAAA